MGNFIRRWPIDLGDERRLATGEETFDARQRLDKRVGEVWKGSRADNHQQRDAVSHNGVALVRFVSNSTIMSERDPAAPAYRFKPGLIGRIRPEVIRVSFDSQTARSENLGKTLPEIAIGKADEA
jgi:hypothetical protein